MKRIRKCCQISISAMRYTLCPYIVQKIFGAQPREEISQERRKIPLLSDANLPFIAAAAAVERRVCIDHKYRLQ